MTIKRRLIGGLALAAAATVTASCGEAETGNTDRAATSGSQIVTSARSNILRYSTPVTKLDIPPLSKPAPTGIKLTLISCQTCQPQNAGVSAAAKALGWKLKVVTPQFTPEDYAGAWTSVVQTRPDAIIGIAPFPLTAVAKQLDDAKRAGITVVTQGAGGTVPLGGESAIAADGSGANIFTALGTLYADSAIADAGKAPDAPLVIDGSVPAWKAITAAYQRRITSVGGKFNEIDVPLADVGKGGPGRIVSYLQAHPNTRYLTLTIPAFGIGLKQALQSAGLDGKVKIIIGAADKTTGPQVKSGEALAAVGLETISGGWRMVDAVARKLTGSDMKCCEHLGSTYLIVNKANAGLADTIDVYPNRSSDFITAWKGPTK